MDISINDNSEKKLKGRKDPEVGFYYRYPHAAITADCVIFGFNGKSLRILLIERGNEPYLGYWALPGGFMRIDESIEETAARELREETNLSGIFLEQFKVFSKVHRDPRERVVTVAFIALVKPEDYNLIAGDDADKAMWFDDDMLPPLAFDHAEIIAQAREYLKEILLLKPVAFQLLNKTFTISQLQTVYEVINRTSYDRRNFLRTAIDADVISEVKFEDMNTQVRNGRLYTFNAEAFPEIKSERDISEDEYEDFDGACFADCDTGLHISETVLSMPDQKAKRSMIVNPNRSSSKRRVKASDESKKAPTKGLFGFFRKS